MAIQVTPKASRNLLGSVTKGKIDLPPKLHVYGLEKTGKSTFGADSPSPIFICAENGTEQLDIQRMPSPHSFQDVMDSVQELIAGPHDFRTLVIDSLDWLEPMVWDLVCREAKTDNIEDVGGGFQKGYGPGGALDVWRLLLVKLDELRSKRKMGITLLSHAVVRTFKNPQGADFGEYAPKIHAKAASLVNEWADAILFSKYATTAVAEKGAGKAKKTYGIGDATVVMHTRRQAAFQAGNRFGLPEELEMKYAAFAEACADAKRSTGQQAQDARTEIERLTAKIGDAELAPKIAANVAQAGDDLAFLEVVRKRASEILTERQNAKIDALLEDVMDVAVTNATAGERAGADEAGLDRIIESLRAKLNLARANGETT